VQLSFPMTTKVIASNPRVSEDTSRVAVQRGPIIYCMEELDQPAGVSLSDISVRVSERMGKDFHDEYSAGLLDGVVVLHHDGAVCETPSATEALYMSLNGAGMKTRPAKLTLIPYYAWANRQPTPMEVWTRYIRS
jgi:DUF1680 family protein